MSSSTYQQIIDLERGGFNRWNVIPNVQTVATYSFTTQTIELSEFATEDYKKALSGAPEKRRKLTVILAHELRHWLDHVGTVWGQQMLSLGYNALNSRLRNVPEELWRIVRFRQALRDNRFERYYTTADSNRRYTGEKWKHQLSAGARFDHEGKMSENHPILFTRFSWQDDTPACRVPMSVASLLETGAMHFELRAEESFLGFLDAEERPAAFESLQRKYLETMYDTDLAEYSVAAHAVSNVVGTKDCPSTFELSSALAGVALNLTGEHFELLHTPESFRAWGKRNRAFIANTDRGYAFLVLATLAPHGPVHNVDEWVERTLDSAGLPSLQTIKADAMRAIGAFSENLIDGPLAGIRDRHRDAGLKIFAEHGPIFKFERIIEDMSKRTIPLPPIVLGQDLSIVANGEILDWDASPIKKDIEALLNTYHQCSEFSEACGI